MESSHSMLFATSAHQSPEPRDRRKIRNDSPQRNVGSDKDPVADNDGPNISPDIFATPVKSFFDPDSSDLESPASGGVDKVKSASPAHHDDSDDWSLHKDDDASKYEDDTITQKKISNSELDYLRKVADHTPIFDAHTKADEYSVLDYKSWTPVDYQSNAALDVHSWDIPQSLATDPVFDPTQFLNANTSNVQMQSGVASTTKDRFLSTHLKTLSTMCNAMQEMQALLLEERGKDMAVISAPLPFHFDTSFGSFKNAPVSPTRPERPHSDVDSFLANPPFDESLRSNQSAPQPVLKPPPVPTLPPDLKLPMPKPATTRSMSLPPPSGRRRSTMKHVSMAPPPIRLERLDYKPPEQYTPFPFPKPAAAVLSEKDIFSPLPQSFPPMPPVPTVLAFDNHHDGHEDQRSPSMINHPRGSRISSRSRSPHPAKSRRSNAYSTHAPAVSSKTSGPSRQCTVRLLVHRRNAPNGRRTATISIARNAEDESVKQTQDFKFDDAMLFKQMREHYFRTLLGSSGIGRFWKRWFSARNLKRIRMIQDGEKPNWRRMEEDEGVPEQELLARFRNPKQAVGAYSWVHWAQRISDGEVGDYGYRLSRDLADARLRLGLAHARNVSGSTLDARRENEQMTSMASSRGLEFVEGWSLRRIAMAALLVLLAAAGICLLWIFLGPADDWRGAIWLQQAQRSRIGFGCVLGFLGFIIGCVGIAAWMWISYRVM